MVNWFNVGKVVNTHGIKGEIRVISSTDFPEERYKIGNTLFLFMDEKKEPIELKVATHRSHKNFELLTFEGHQDINIVEKFKGGVLKVPESQLNPLEADNEFYFHEIIGCDVFTIDGVEIGRIKEILTPGANDVWVIKGKGGKEILIPFIEPVVKQIDVKNKKILIEPMEGLLS
jgi:16S rRNA processing protein RimM